MGYLKIPNLCKDLTILDLLKEAYFMEKIHGCLKSNTTIKMADGSKRTISSLVKQKAIGQKVLGVNRFGKIVSTKILNVFDNGRSQNDNWLMVEGKRKGAGKGNSRWRVVCTDNHKFYVDGKYVQAKDLSPGSKIKMIRNDIGLTPLQKQILLGIMLGDGSFCDSVLTASVSFGHKIDHEEYVKWIRRGLGNICNSAIDIRMSGYGTKMCRSRTNSLFFIKDYLKSFIKNGKKIVPDWVSQEMGPVALAFWYMDDGSLGHHKKQEDRASFAVCNFTKEDCGVLILSLKKFGIKANYFVDANGYPRIRLNANDAEKLFILIAPYIPPVMQYKLPKRYRSGSAAWLPKLNQGVYKNHLIEQEVTKITDISVKHQKYDLETETHNFFANDVLVHNSSAHARWSKKDWGEGELRFHAGGIKHETFVSIFDSEALTKAFKELGYSDVVVYGEVYGGKLQRMKSVYGEQLRFIAFEVKIGDTWLSVPDAHDVVNKLGLDFVDYVRGPATAEFANEQRDRPSVQAIRNGVGDDKWREGVVIRPLIELTRSNGKRLMAKHRRPEFRETKSERELSPEKMAVLRQATAIAEEWVTENRLVHVLQALGFVDGGDNRPDFKDIPSVKDAMLADVKAESEGEIEWSKNAERAVKTRAVEMFKRKLASLK